MKSRELPEFPLSAGVAELGQDKTIPAMNIVALPEVPVILVEEVSTDAPPVVIREGPYAVALKVGAPVTVVGMLLARSIPIEPMRQCTNPAAKG